MKVSCPNRYLNPYSPFYCNYARIAVQYQSPFVGQKHFIVHCAKRRKGLKFKKIISSMTNIYSVGTTVRYDIINCDIGTTEFYGVQL
jgi:hypothetical protein